jgi:hypothetical protein
MIYCASCRGGLSLHRILAVKTSTWFTGITAAEGNQHGWKRGRHAREVFGGGSGIRVAIRPRQLVTLSTVCSLPQEQIPKIHAR